MRNEDNAELEKAMRYAMVASILVGVVVAAYLIYLQKQESFSALYLVPGSYSNYVVNGKVSFTYGVKSYEKRTTDYYLEVYLGNARVTDRSFSLKKGEVREERIELTGLDKLEKFPIKVRLVMYANDAIYEVHFWLKGKK